MLKCRIELNTAAYLFKIQDILSELYLMVGNAASDPHKIRHQRRHSSSVMKCRIAFITGTNLFEVQDILSELDLILGNAASDPHKIRHQRRHSRGECGEDSAPQ